MRDSKDREHPQSVCKPPRYTPHTHTHTHTQLQSWVGPAIDLEGMEICGLFPMTLPQAPIWASGAKLCSYESFQADLRNK